MANDTKSDQPDKNAPTQIGKAIGALLLLYVLIAGPAIWKVRRNCLLQRDDCDYYGLLEWILSDRLSLIASAIILVVLLQITWIIIGLARDGRLGIQQDPPEPKFNVSGLMVALIVFFLYLGASSAILISAANDHGQFGADNAEIFVWKIMGPMYGAGIVWMIFWNVNDYFVKPVSNIVLLVLFLATLGSIQFFVKMTIFNW